MNDPGRNAAAGIVGNGNNADPDPTVPDRAHPNEAMRLVLRRLKAHGVPVEQLRPGPKWVSHCPAHDGRRTGPAVTWHQRGDGSVSVGEHRADGEIRCEPGAILAALGIEPGSLNGRADSSPGASSREFSQPARRRGPVADSFAIYERLRQALLNGGYAGRRAHSDRYECPACGAAGDGHGLKVDHFPDRARKIMLVCHAGRCEPAEILAPLGMTLAELCAADDADELGTDDAGEPDTEASTEFTDAHLAAKAAGDVLDGRYLWAAGLGWLRWDGARWKRTPDPEAREQIRRWVVGNYEAASRDVADALRRGDKNAADAAKAREKAWYGACSRSRIGAITDLARGVELVRADAGDFDAHPDLLNVGNGVVDLRTGELRPHDPRLLFTKVAGADYHPGARHPDWDKALDAVPAAVAAWLQVRIGQAATGYAPDDDLVTVAQGSGKNGKSTFFTGVARALGEFYRLVSDRVLLANPGDHPTELMELRGARFALIEETPEERKFDVQRLKKITGTTEITARYIAQDPVTFPVTHALFVTSNYRPVVTQTDYGTWRRLALTRFRRTFDGADADPALRDRVKQDPAVHRAVLAWIVAGARRWYAAGRVLPAAPAVVVDDTRDWRAGSDLVLGYWTDRLVPDPGAHIMAAELQKDFNAWLAAKGHPEWSERSLVERFREHEETERHHVVKERVRRSAGLSRCCSFHGVEAAPERYRAWIGVRFVEPSDLQERESGTGGTGRISA